MPSLDFSFESSLKGTSKDSRKLFNPRLFSQTRTDVSVQFSRNRRRPAAGRRILAEALVGVKQKRSGTFTVSPAFAAKELTPHPRAGTLNIGRARPRVKGIAHEPGQRMHRGSRRR